MQQPISQAPVPQAAYAAIPPPAPPAYQPAQAYVPPVGRGGGRHYGGRGRGGDRGRRRGQPRRSQAKNRAAYRAAPPAAEGDPQAYQAWQVGATTGIVSNNQLVQSITTYPKSNPTQPPTSKSNNNYYSSLQYDANDCSDDETVIMANKEGANLMDEEGTVQTAFSVWGSDDESELDKGVGGLDPTHHDINHVNGRENARERPALITIDNKSSFESDVTRGSSEQKISNPAKFFVRQAALSEEPAIRNVPYQSNGMTKY